MNNEDINFYKTHLTEARKLKEQSDYEIFDSFLIAANDFEVKHLELLLLGFDDQTEDQTAMYSLALIFKRIYNRTDKEVFFEVFVPNMVLLFPHAIGWARTLFSVWNYEETENLLFINIVKRHSIIIDKVISVYDFILSERDENNLESQDAEYVRKYKEMLIGKSL